MNDVCAQVATFIATSLNMTLGGNLFYYALPDDVNDGAVVTRRTSNISVPVQIDASVHDIQIIARGTSSTLAYELCKRIYDVMLSAEDEENTDTPGFIQLDETRARVFLYQHPIWDKTDQQGRQTFLFNARLITKQ